MARRTRLCVGFSVLCLLHTSSAAAATAAPQLSLERFDPTPAGDRNFGADGPGVAGGLRLAGKLSVDWAHNPLVFQTANNHQAAAWLVSHQLMVNLGISLEFLQRFMVSVDLPLTVLQSGSEARLGGLDLLPPSGFRVADLRVGVRGLVWSWGPQLNLGLQGYLWIPMGSAASASGLYISDGHVRGRVEVLLGGEGEVLYWSAALGPDFRRQIEYFGESQGTSMRFNGAIGARLVDRRLSVGPEAYVAVPVHKPDRGNVNAELLVGAHLDLPADFVIGAGAGPGLTSGIGTPDVRVVVTLATLNSFMDPPPPAPPPDSDGDGVADVQDACLAVPGVASADPNQRGCPPPPPALDSDGDGVIDAQDACPTVPGVVAEDPNRRGCPLPPPPDTDGDGVVDAQDACPAVPGVVAEDPNERGCPLLPPPPPPLVGTGDHDGDGVTDDVDRCPELPGQASPDRTKNGCPSGAVVGDQIVLLEPIMFKTGSAQILPQSDAILTTALESMRKLPAATGVRVEGHTDSQGNRERNRVLSEQRAQAVVAWFVAHGVEGARLSFKGFGPDTPIATNLTNAGRTVNRRVELHLEKR